MKANVMKLYLENKQNEVQKMYDQTLADNGGHEGSTINFFYRAQKELMKQIMEDLFDEEDSEPDDYDYDEYAYSDGDDIGCKDCPDDECTGHCMSCAYRSL